MRVTLKLRRRLALLIVIIRSRPFTRQRATKQKKHKQQHCHRSYAYPAMDLCVLIHTQAENQYGIAATA